MGLPEININFFGKLNTRTVRQAAGVVALILRDDEQTADYVTYTLDSKIDGWSEDNERYIRMALRGEPLNVVVVRLGEDDDIDDGLSVFNNKRIDYLAIPSIQVDETEKVVTWIKGRRRNNRRFKAVLPNTAANHIGVINFTSTGLVDKDGREYTTEEFTARIAGGLAGLPFTRSATYLVMRELAHVDEIDDPDGAIDNGELILVDDGEKIKIGRGVNSLVEIEVADRMNDEFKSIRAVDIMDMIGREIYEQFENHYVGQVPNRYDNQVLYINDIIKGFVDLENLQLLDQVTDNSVVIDVDKQRQAWEDAGVDTSMWDDQQVRETSFRRNVFLRAKIRVVDTMEDLDFDVHI